MTATVAVTGGTGFLGGHVVRALHAAGWSVRVLVRPGRAPPTPAHGVPGTLDDATALARLLDGAQVLVHCAGAVRGTTRSDFAAVNETGVAAVLIAARAVGARLVHLSSLAAREPTLSHYAASKAAGEALVAASRVPHTTLRPPAVYGPGDVELRPLLAALRRGLALVPGPLHARFALLYAEDLAAAVVAAAASPATGAYHELHDGHPDGHDWPDLAAAVARLTGRRARLLALPGPLLSTLAQANAGLARCTGRAPMLTPGKARELRHPDWTVRDHSFTDATGWRPRVALDEGLRRTFAAMA